MNKLMKNLSVLLLAVVCLLTLAGCNKVKEKNFEKIEDDMTKSEVVAILEEENASTMVGDYVVCYWFKGADSYQEAIEKVAAGKEVLTIKVVFADNKVVDKTFGNFVVE